MAEHSSDGPQTFVQNYIIKNSVCGSPGTHHFSWDIYTNLYHPLVGDLVNPHFVSYEVLW